MRIEIKEDFKFWIPMFNGIMGSTLLYGTFLLGILWMFYKYPIESVEVVEFLLNFKHYLIFVFLISFPLIIDDMFKFTIKYECMICDKKDYPDNMVILNPKQVEEGMIEKCVCKEHKKPYMRKIKEDW